MTVHKFSILERSCVFFWASKNVLIINKKKDSLVSAHENVDLNREDLKSKKKI